MFTSSDTPAAGSYPVSPTSQPSDRFFPPLPADLPSIQAPNRPISAPGDVRTRTGSTPGPSTRAQHASEDHGLIQYPVDNSSPKQKPKKDKDVPADKSSKKWPKWAPKFERTSNSLASFLGSERFFPSPMDQECEKAARIIKAFCKDGVYTDADSPDSTNTANESDAKHKKKAKKPSRRLVVIPPKVIANAKGLAIFSTFRVGLGASGSTGSSVLVARLPDGNWSPPSAIKVGNIGTGMVIGLDIYECVVVINTKEALEAFTRFRFGLGLDYTLSAGPWGGGHAIDWDINLRPDEDAPKIEKPPRTTMTEAPKTTTRTGLEPPPLPLRRASPANAAAVLNGLPLTNGWPTDGSFSLRSATPSRDISRAASRNKTDARKSPKPRTETVSRSNTEIRNEPLVSCYSYVKSRGFFMGVQIDGTIFTERKTANATFYGESVSVPDILAGKVPKNGPEGMWPTATNGLFAVLKGAEVGKRRSSHHESHQTVETQRVTRSIAASAAVLSRSGPIDLPSSSARQASY